MGHRIGPKLRWSSALEVEMGSQAERRTSIDEDRVYWHLLVPQKTTVECSQRDAPAIWLARSCGRVMGQQAGFVARAGKRWHSESLPVGRPGRPSCLPLIDKKSGGPRVVQSGRFEMPRIWTVLNKLARQTFALCASPCCFAQSRIRTHYPANIRQTVV